ncbi:zf-TFIIB domain-containing protein [Nioella ostreopsis]|uniref:TFIIB-type zinc ribbon-containing protein n=1 Tax=Nioella ostreopsis TaxID=2448479 RepID=UPI000FD984DA|nr:zf-TFIIB domain-containing protein [Nioella ostreopsis]
MQCPIDGTALVITERSGVEIDYCPTCRGVWLDRGELDKIIERSSLVDNREGNWREAPARGSRSDHDGGDRRKKKDGIGSFLGDIFDF